MQTFDAISYINMQILKKTFGNQLPNTYHNHLPNTHLNHFAKYLSQPFAKYLSQTFAKYLSQPFAIITYCKQFTFTFKHWSNICQTFGKCLSHIVSKHEANIYIYIYVLIFSNKFNASNYFV